MARLYLTTTPLGNDNGSAAQAVRPGLWSLRSLIAYGYEVESVYRAMRQQSERDYGHPIDPVVEWQRISSSHTAYRYHYTAL